MHTYMRTHIHTHLIALCICAAITTTSTTTITTITPSTSTAAIMRYRDTRGHFQVHESLGATERIKERFIYTYIYNG